MTTLSDRSQAVARLYQAVISRAVIGTAVDTNGDPVPNAVVELRRSDTGDRRTVTAPDTSSDSSPSINFPPAIMRNCQLPTCCRPDLCECGIAHSFLVYRAFITGFARGYV